MGKIFDALKKAERERGGAGSEPAPVPPLPAPASPPDATLAPPMEKPRVDLDAGTPPPRPSRKPAPALGKVGIGQAFRTAWRWIRTLGRDGLDEEFANVKRRIIDFDPSSPAAEQYRGIRTRIELLNQQGACKILAIISALPGEGKTMTAVNLALVMAMSLGRRVLLVDCDLRDPRVHKTLDIPTKAGLAEVLRGEVPLDEALYETRKENLAVLPAGTLPTNPAELLATQRMRETIDQLRGRYDHVILDTPAALPVADAEIVCNLVDGIIFVVRAASTPREQALRAIENFDRERIVGMVLNSTEESETSAYGSEA
jgi:capsular exopolysaccharide synthesis family protein